MNSRFLKFDEIAQSVTERVDDPASAGVTRYVGLEHLDPESIEITRWGTPDDVSATKLRFYPKDVIYGRRRAYQKKLGVARFEGICSAHALVLRARQEVCLAQFLPYFLHSDQFHNRALEISVGSLSPTINWSTLKLQQFELPSIEEQQRIVELLSGVDAHAEALRNQLHVAKETRKAVLHHLLNARGDDWTETTLGNVAEINSETAKNWGADEIVTYIDLSSVTFDSGVGVELFKGRFKDAPGRARRIVRTGDILVSTVRPYLRGFAVVPSRLDGALASTGFAVLRAKQGASISGFIWALIGMEEFVSHLMELATGSNYPAVRPSDVASTKLLLPPVKEQQRIVDEISKVDAVIQETTSALAATRQLRSALLNKEIS
jgi:restriction endonuclease S subunit